MKTSRYFAFEGIEGSGKSSASLRVAEILQSPPHKLKILRLREPGGTPIGEEVRTVLLTPRVGKMSPFAEAALFAAQRAQLVEEVVVPALAAGHVVLTDRSVYSSLAYQGGARGLGIPAVRAMNDFAIRGFWPGTVIYLRVDPEIGFARESVKDRIGQDGIELQHLVAKAYESLVAAEPEKFVIIDAAMPLENVVEEAVSAILERTDGK